MKVKTIRQIKDLKGKRVLLRADFNVPINSQGRVGRDEDYRLVQTLPTINYLINKGAKVIIMAHLGRPDGKVVKELRLDPVVKRLSKLLKKEIYKSDQILGKAVKKFIGSMEEGDVLMLENIRFDRREEKGSKMFARQLAKLGDVYVNDSFSVDHRNHVSTAVIQKYLPSYAGLLLEDEVKNLSKVFIKPPRPLVTIVGGAKISTKVKVIKRFLEVTDYILLGGALANTVLQVMGISVGMSLVEPEMIPVIKKINLTDDQLRVPVDGVMAKSYDSKNGRIDALGDIGKNELILDIGPDTIKLYKKIIKSAKMIVWNGPMGLIENPVFAKGTKELVKILASCKAETIVGGGETVQMIRTMKLEDKFDFISTGGGAMLEFLEGKELPGLKRLVKK